jgi:tripartite-type tricarboxylate transporter receptor subunit TctC
MPTGQVKRTLAAVLLVFIWIFAVAEAAQEEYPDPTKIITLICPAAPGGMSDNQMRNIAIQLSKQLGGVRVQVENIAGASGKIAFEKVYKARPDGYTILNYNLPSPVFQEMEEKTARFKTSDFAPIYAISTIPNVLVVHIDHWKTLDEFVQEGQKRVVSIGTTGKGTANYFQAVAFVEATKIKANLVPFEGGAESTTTLAGKHIDAVCTPVLTAFSLIRGGKLRPLIVFSDEADSTYPGVLLSKDSKWEIAAFPLIGAYVGPPNLSVDKVKILEEAFAKAVKEPAFVEWAKKVNLNISPINSTKLKSTIDTIYQNAEKFRSYFTK